MNKIIVLIVLFSCVGIGGCEDKEDNKNDNTYEITDFSYTECKPQTKSDRIKVRRQIFKDKAYKC